MRTMWFLYLLSGQAQLLLTPAITFILEYLSAGGQTPALSLGPLPQSGMRGGVWKLHAVSPHFALGISPIWLLLRYLILH